MMVNDGSSDMTKPRIAALTALFAAALFLGPTAALTQETGRPDEAAGGEEDYRARLIGLPFIYYTPETKLAFGAGGVFNFRAGREKAEARTSSVWAYASYNMARQFSALVKPDIYLKGNSLFLSGSLSYERAPQKFYGVGNDTRESDEESYTSRIFAIQIGVKRRIAGGLFGGLRFDVEKVTMEEIEAGRLLDAGDILGCRGGLHAGIGASLDWDTRDSVLFPRRGAFHQISADAYGAMAGSDFSFTRFKLDIRKYLPIQGGHVLALQAYLFSAGGEVPFYDLGLLGGESLMRGYYRGRYRDKGLGLIQAEFRTLVTERIGVVGFAGLADIFPGWDDLSQGRVKASLGTGLRYVINKRDGTTVRLDLAWGRASFGLYATAQEAF
jgi:hypothetical protein